jgi:transposase
LPDLALDEIDVGRTQKFSTLVSDLETGRSVWVAHGRGGECGRGCWRRGRWAKARIQAVALDLRAADWKAVPENLRETAVVFAKFHIVQPVNDKLDQLRRALVRAAAGITPSTIQGLRYLWRTRRAHLAGDKRQVLDAALKFNQPVFTAYDRREELGWLWAQPTAAARARFLEDWWRRAAASGLRLFQSLAKPLLGQRRGILNWMAQPINSGRMEGINNKIRTLTRRADGDRDESFFILKLYNLHRSRKELVG